MLCLGSWTCQLSPNIDPTSYFGASWSRAALQRQQFLSFRRPLSQKKHKMPKQPVEAANTSPSGDELAYLRLQGISSPPSISELLTSIPCALLSSSWLRSCSACEAFAPERTARTHGTSFRQCHSGATCPVKCKSDGASRSITPHRGGECSCLGLLGETQVLL